MYHYVFHNGSNSGTILLITKSHHHFPKGIIPFSSIWHKYILFILGTIYSRQFKTISVYHLIYSSSFHMVKVYK